MLTGKTPSQTLILNQNVAVLGGGIVLILLALDAMDFWPFQDRPQYLTGWRIIVFRFSGAVRDGSLR